MGCCEGRSQEIAIKIEYDGKEYIKLVDPEIGRVMLKKKLLN